MNSTQPMMNSTTKAPTDDTDNFITVVSVGTDLASSETSSFPATDVHSSGYVTVLTIGDIESDAPGNDVVEEVLVYRLPGERLGFGLKFEGGTKASEFVKRLFIQSCAPDSPASRVQSSWGKLVEGDEVLEIDCIAVNTMTRIDCVRCLKDSNVVIKLLVRHFCENGKYSESRTRSIEDLPQVVSAEKKRVPPPPPPVPPRKIPKKFYNKGNNNNNSREPNPVPAIRQTINEVTVNKTNKKFQSPRSSGRSSCSPDILRRDRRFSDGSLGPPDAEVYVDLFSQESTTSLSESDDTGSSISTVVDRFSSFPTTTTSSLAGSLPSTPTSIQKHLDFSNLLNFDEEDLPINLNKNLIQATVVGKYEENSTPEEKLSNLINEESTPLQPPSCFQDAPLSYGNENMRITESKSFEIKSCDLTILQDKKVINKHVECTEKQSTTQNSLGSEERVYKKPPVPPRYRDLISNYSKINESNKDTQDIHDENMNISNLPRLVDFVPKTNGSFRDDLSNSTEIVKRFLENERLDNNCNDECGSLDERDDDKHLDIYNSDLDLYSSKWSLSSQLATIGEVEEENGHDLNYDRSINSTPIVIVENADCDAIEETRHSTNKALQETAKHDTDINGNMETLPSGSRQPPDGHEFPDYAEASSESSINQNYHSPYISQLNASENLPSTYKIYKSTECLNSSQNQSSFIDMSSVPIKNKSFNKINSISNSDLSSIANSKNSDAVSSLLVTGTGLELTLHTRSQSLIDMSSISKLQKNDRWNLLAEQRKKSLSKLKGLVIPEHISENEATPGINIPEIISHTTPSFIAESKINSDQNNTHFNCNETEPLMLPLTSPPWTLNNSNIPKYSPAFKRKNLQVYPQNNIHLKNEESQQQHREQSTNNINNMSIITSKNLTPKSTEKNCVLEAKIENDLRLDNLTDAPKSLESITSPTKSDCSFDYVTNSTKFKPKQEQINRNCKESSNNHSLKLHKDLGKSEDESDNDSAVSSSQSSYISRCSPPPSPTRSYELLDYDTNSQMKLETIHCTDKNLNMQHRLLKPFNVEVINRKNILASAKCRNGQDFKSGLPQMHNKNNIENSDLSLKEISTSKNNSVLPQACPLETESISTSVLNHVNVKTKKQNPEESTRKSNISLKNGSVNSSVDCQKVLSELNPGRLKASTINHPKAVTSVSDSTYLKNSAKNLKETRPQIKINTRPINNLHKTTKSLSVTDLRKSFEKFGTSVPLLPLSTSSDTKMKKKETANKKTDAVQGHRNQSLLSPGKQKNETNKTSVTKETVICEEKIASDLGRKKIILFPEFFGGSVGITLAGGTDYETKEITIHKIRFGSVAFNDGQLKRGDRIISINGKSTSGLTHAQSVDMLKEPVDKFIFVVENGKEEHNTSPQRKSFILNNPPELQSLVLPARNITHTISLTKEGAGLGFSIEGGKDSPQGDLPLRVKKVFQGGLADKNGEIKIGDELLAINNISLTNLSRMEAWSLMKKLPEGNISIHIHR